MIILDTHAWIWWIDESKKLAPQAKETIQQSDVIGISAISCWELAMLVAKGRLGLSMDTLVWLESALQRPKIILLPLTPEIAALSTHLPGDFHGDPADRLIVFTSLVHKAILISRDEKIQKYNQIKVIWS